jgi:heat shock protein HtpX
MARTRYGTDRGLIARMGITMFLIGLVFLAFIAGIAVLLAAFKAASTGAVIALAVIIGLCVGFGSYYFSDKIALRAAGARLVTPQEAPVLHGVVDRICALANMPKPRVAIAPARMPNAFATGRSSKVAVVCATTGLLDTMADSPTELEAVLAHEMSHVAHRDVAVMTIASVLGIIAGLMVRFSYYSELFGGGGRGRNDQGGYNALIMLGVLLISVVVYAISFLLIRMLSRYRELAADRSAALLTGRPSALASALVKVSGEMQRIPVKDLRAAAPLNAFYFAPALSAGRAKSSLAELFSTHPSLERRLSELDKISKQLSR